MSSVRSRRASLLVALLLLGPALLGARAECVLSGSCASEPNPDDAALGAWKYCLTVNWNTGGQQGLSHHDLLLNLAECPCVCDEFSFAARDTAGTSNGEDGAGAPCSVPYFAEFLCDGDPSIEIDEPLVKFSPLDGDCQPTHVGGGVFCFYTDWPPVNATAPNQLLALKAGQIVCFGELSGALPACTCPPTPARGRSWGEVKSLFID
jgi:hypothetical protein